MTRDVRMLARPGAGRAPASSGPDARWPEHSRLFAVGDRGGWSVDDDARARRRRRAPARIPDGAAGVGAVRRASVGLPHEPLRRAPPALARLVAPARHGVPPRPARDARRPRVRRCFETLRRAARIGSPASRSRTPRWRSSSSSRASSPSACSASRSGSTSSASRSATSRCEQQRASALGLPVDAFVVGSFQKDGVGWGDGLEPKLDQGPGRARRRRSSGCAPTVPELHVLLTGPGARLRPRRARAARHPVPAPARAHATRSSRRAYHALDVYVVASRAGGRAEGRARVDGDRRPARHDPCRAGAGPRRGRRERHGSSTSRTSTALAASAVRVHADAALVRIARARRAARRRSGTRYERLRPALGGAPRRVRRGRERIDGAPRRGRYARAGARWARLLVRRGSRPGLRVFYGHDRVPGARRAGRRAARRRSRSSRRGSRTARPTSRSSTSARPGCRATSAPLLWLARRRGHPDRRQPGRRRLPGRGRATGRTSSTGRCGARVARGRPRPLPERVLQALGRRVPRRRPAAWEMLPNAVDVERFAPPGAARGRPGPAARRRPDAGPTGSSSRSRRSRTSLADAPGRAAARHGQPRRGSAASSSTSSASRTRPPSRPLRAGATRPALFRRAHLLLHTKVNDPCPTSCSRRWRAASRSCTRRAAARSSSSATTAGSASQHEASWERDEPPSAEALADAVDAGARGPARVLRRRARARAVERFALAPWLDRHAELFTELTT